MRMKRIAIACCLLWVCVLAVGQTNVEISGTSEGAAGKGIGLYAYSDMLTQAEVLLDSTTIGDDGSFSLRCFVNYPRLVFVQAESYSQSFYIEPGRRYEVFLPAFDWDLADRRNVHLDPVALPLRFLNVDTNELNLKIMRFDETVDSFLAANRERLDFRFRPDRRVFAQLQTLVDRRFGSGDETFFERYVRFQMLEMRLALRIDSRKKLINNYITNSPVRYYDENYMRLFLDLYAHSISSGTRRVGQHRLVHWVETGDLATYMDSIGLDPLLANEQVRELAVLQALKESYYDRNYSREAVRRMVDNLAAQSKFDDHRILARHLLESFVQMEHGNELPPFVLPDVNRQMVSLDDFRGKWVYLSFVRVGDPHSLREIETMAHFSDTLAAKHPDVALVSVSCDREFQKMYHFLKNSRRGARCNWTWLHFDGNYRLLERYGVTSYPTFMLIDPEGNLYYDYTPAPASGILLHGPWYKEELPQYDKNPFRN